MEKLKSITVKELMEMTREQILQGDAEANKIYNFVSKEQREMTREALEPDVQECDELLYEDLKDWIKANINPIRTIYKDQSTSYGLKHIFENWDRYGRMGNRYVTNNQFKAAMIDCGYWYPADEDFFAREGNGNLHFNISRKSNVFTIK